MENKPIYFIIKHMIALQVKYWAGVPKQNYFPQVKQLAPTCNSHVRWLFCYHCFTQNIVKTNKNVVFSF